MFIKKRERKTKIVKLSDLKKSGRFSKSTDSSIKRVERMDKKSYLKYYIKILENQIEEATKILSEKKKELKKLK